MLSNCFLLINHRRCLLLTELVNVALVLTFFRLFASLILRTMQYRVSKFHAEVLSPRVHVFEHNSCLSVICRRFYRFLSAGGTACILCCFFVLCSFHSRELVRICCMRDRISYDLKALFCIFYFLSAKHENRWSCERSIKAHVVPVCLIFFSGCFFTAFLSGIGNGIYHGSDGRSSTTASTKI